MGNGLVERTYFEKIVENKSGRQACVHVGRAPPFDVIVARWFTKA
jgi:hypothetical protein